MKINTHVGNVDIKIDTSRIEGNLKEAQKLLNEQIVADCTPLIPFHQGALRNSYDYPEGIYGGEISWGGIDRGVPYAHYIYEGELYLAANGSSWAKQYEKKYPSGKPLAYHTPGTTDHFFDEAKKQHGKEWIDLVKKTVGKG